MVSYPVMCVLHGNTRVDLVSPQVTTRATSYFPNFGICV